MKKFPVLRICVFEDLTCTLETAHEIFFKIADLCLFHAENFLVDVSHVLLCHGFKIFLRDRSEKSLDIADGKDILKIVDKNQHQKMFTGVTLLLRRREKLVLRVIVDHGLSQDLVILVTFGGGKILFHKSCHLIHVQVDIRDLIRFYIIKFSDFCKNAVHHFFFIACHHIITSALYYIVLNTTCKETFFTGKRKLMLWVYPGEKS